MLGAGNIRVACPDHDPIKVESGSSSSFLFEHDLFPENRLPLFGIMLQAQPISQPPT